MTTGRGTPVDSTVVITHDIVLNLFKVGVITYTTDTLDTHLRKVIAHSQQFILAKHHIRRIDLNVLRFTTGIAALYKSQQRTHKDTYTSKAIDATLRWAQLIGDCSLTHFPDVSLKQNVTTLEDGRHLVDNLRMNPEGITALQTDAHRIIVAIRETQREGTKSPDAPPAPQQHDIHHDTSHQQPKEETADGEQRWHCVSHCNNQDNSR